MSASTLGPHGSLPQGAQKRASVEAMFDRVAPTYERTNRVISLGLDRGWRDAAMVELGLARGSRVLDVACGTGDFCRDLTDAGHDVVGADFSAGMLGVAHTTAPLVRADAAALPARAGAFDGVTCGFALRNFVELSTVFDECSRVLRRGGRFVALDAAVPTNPVMRLGNAVWFRGAVPILGRLLAGDADAYRYLPKSTAYLPGLDALAELLQRAGFSDVDVRTLTGGSVLLLSGTRR
ncbi:MAG TPA: ubiquinone/menaquinone biosynthesis methyltransferase [Acidimicrobiia bacterium]|nr:ubiquinone/menaquinone biosynthesis methyltransferase [Acidimicrobiia bacterium]